MSRMPRILPLAGVAVAGVLAINVASGAKTLPNLFGGAKAWAEGVAGAPPALPVAAKPAPVCAPTAAELAKEAGLSPAELQILQSLGVRRGELDEQAQTLDTNQQLLAAAAAKLDERVKALAALKGDIQALLVQSDEQQKVENQRLINVFSAMKPKDAAARMVTLEDSVLVPIAAGMKERILAAIIAQMPPPDAKKLTENLAHRYAAAQAIKDGQAAVATPSPVAQMALATPPKAPPPVLAGAKATLGAPPAPVAGAKTSPPAADAAPAKPTAAPAAKPKPRKVAARKPAAKPAVKPTTTTAAASPGPQPYKPPEKPTPSTTAAAGDTTKTPAPIPAK